MFGDSTVDCGNNYLITLARASMPPYGRDFDNHALNGRFYNETISIDYLALYKGLPMVPTALGTTNVTNMTKGLNYALACAGIVPEFGSNLGQHISLVSNLACFLVQRPKFPYHLDSQQLNKPSNARYFTSQLATITSYTIPCKMFQGFWRSKTPWSLAVCC
ncbi:hypothetical protein L7F22_062858 [Adiantum nelumboides]|nr:hypothetical protein [Adiantum nelumboides]